RYMPVIILPSWGVCTMGERNTTSSARRSPSAAVLRSDASVSHLDRACVGGRFSMSTPLCSREDLRSFAALRLENRVTLWRPPPPDAYATLRLILRGNCWARGAH